MKYRDVPSIRDRAASILIVRKGFTRTDENTLQDPKGNGYKWNMVQKEWVRCYALPDVERTCERSYGAEHHLCEVEEL